MLNLGLVSSEDIDHDLHDSLMHAQYSHQVRVLVEDLVVHNVTKKHMKRSKLLIFRCLLKKNQTVFLSKSVPYESNDLPQSINHELFLLLSHSH